MNSGLEQKFESQSCHKTPLPDQKASSLKNDLVLAKKKKNLLRFVRQHNRAAPSIKLLI
jgi:hypothetical protein